MCSQYCAILYHSSLVDRDVSSGLQLEKLSRRAGGAGNETFLVHVLFSRRC